MDTTQLGRKIMTARMKAKLTQQQAAFIAGISLSHYAKIEQGKVASVRSDTLTKLARTFNIKFEF